MFHTLYLHCCRTVGYTDECLKLLSSQDGEELRAAINAKLPAKIDIGPVYNVDPKHRNAYSGD